MIQYRVRACRSFFGPYAVETFGPYHSCLVAWVVALWFVTRFPYGQADVEHRFTP